LFFAWINPLAAHPKPPTSEMNTGPRDFMSKTLNQWMLDLRHADPSVRDKAIRAIVQFGPTAREAVPALVDQTYNMQDGDPRVRAVIALGIIEINDKDVPKVVDALGKRLKEDPQSIIRYHAAVSLIRFGSEAARVLDDLIFRTSDMTAFDIRRACVVALRYAGADTSKGPNPKATNALLHRLRDANGFRDPSGEVRMEAVISLGSIGWPTDPSLQAPVQKALETSPHHNDRRVRIWAHVCLVAVEKGTDNHVKAVIRELKNKDLEVSCTAAQALGALGAKAKAAVPDLVDLLRGKEPPLVIAAA